MQLSCSTVLPTALAIIGTCMCCICGYVAIDQTLSLFEKYGPKEGNGNPTLDEPPKYHINTKTQEKELINPGNPGNTFPSFVHGVQYFLIGLGVFMLISCIGIFYTIHRCKLALKDAIYNQQYISSWNNRNYMLWVLAYVGILFVVWILTGSFAVSPLIKFVLASKRCVDLENSYFGPLVLRTICVDLVQYGIVPFREVPGSGYGLVCGDPSDWGDLNGFCDNYSSSFTLFITCFAGACIVLISLVFNVAKATTVFNHSREFFMELFDENPNSRHFKDNHMRSVYPEDSAYNGHGKSVFNPNYEHNVLLFNPGSQAPSQIGNSYPALSVHPGSDGDGVKAKLYSNSDGNNGMPRRSRKNTARSAVSTKAEDGIPLHPVKRTPSYQSSKLMHHLSSDSIEDVRPNGSVQDIEKKEVNHVSGPPRHAPSDSESYSEQNNGLSDVPSDHTRSTTAFRVRPKKRKSRSTRSDPDISRKSSRRPPARHKHPPIEEYDSPPSDYYLQEDFERRAMRINNRTRSVY